MMYIFNISVVLLVAIPTFPSMKILCFSFNRQKYRYWHLDQLFRGEPVKHNGSRVLSIWPFYLDLVKIDKVHLHMMKKKHILCASD